MNCIRLGWERDIVLILFHQVEMSTKGIVPHMQGFVEGIALGNATRQVGERYGITAFVRFAPGWNTTYPTIGFKEIDN
ncbi:hypothetical protein PMJ6TS7_57640 [Paenibacillus melissococcoides]